VPLPLSSSASTSGQSTSAQSSQSQQKPPSVAKDASILEKLIGPVSERNPANIIPLRRDFFTRLVAHCERQGDPITTIPAVSKQPIDLHRLYWEVQQRDGFERVGYVVLALNFVNVCN